MTSRWQPDWRTFLAALLIVAAFPPWDFTPLIWFCLIPWFEALDRAESKRAALIQGVWFSFFMTIGGFSWVASVLHEFGNLPWAVAIFGLVIFALFSQAQFLIFAPLFRGVKPLRGRHLFFVPLLLALFYSGLDWILPKLFVDTLGHSLYLAENLRQVADIGGASLLTFVIFWINYSLWFLVKKIRNREEPSFWPVLREAGPQLGFGLVLLICFYGYGLMRNNQIHELMAHPSRTVQGAVIQANIGDFDKIASERGVRGAAEKVIQTFFDLSDRALAQSPKPEFLVWPETSYPSTFRNPQTTDELSRDQKVESYVLNRKVPILFGGYDIAEGKDFNSFFFLSPGGEKTSSETDLQIYHKNILLLFGEYIPGAAQFKYLRDQFPQVGNFGRGVGPEIFKIKLAGGRPPVLAGPIICYEALFADYVIGAARKGSELILNITNDSWFGPFGEPQLHLSLTTFRSIETRLPQLRATNTGISALILQDGTLARQSAIGVPEIMNVSIPITAPMWTLMKAWGDWFGPFAFLAGIFGLLVFYLRSPKSHMV